MKTAQGLIDYVKAQVGKPYWFGTFGQTATEQLYTIKKAQYPSYYIATDFTSQYGQRVHDCVGLIKGYLWSDTATSTPKYNSAQDVSAAGMYAKSSKKGSISSFPKVNGTLLYKGATEAKISHVGVYCDGYVYEAKGHVYGVQKTKYTRRGWRYWSYCPFISYSSSSSSSIEKKQEKKQKIYAQYFDSRKAGKYKTKETTIAFSEYGEKKEEKKDTRVYNYGYYRKDNGAISLLVQKDDKTTEYILEKDLRKYA